MLDVLTKKYGKVIGRKRKKSKYSKHMQPADGGAFTLQSQSAPLLLTGWMIRNPRRGAANSTMNAAVSLRRGTAPPCGWCRAAPPNQCADLIICA
jgi:hypothetical protein